MCKAIDLSGQRFGKLVVSDESKRIRGGGKTCISHVVWRCKCDCGNVVWVKTKDLRKRPYANCGCERYELIRKKKLKAVGHAARRAVFCEYSGTAKRKGREFSLSFEEFGVLTQQACYYCGSAPAAVRKGQSGNGDFVFNGIDRLNNSKGYTKENCVACCWRCNDKKSNDDYEQFVAWIRQVVAYIDSKEHTDVREVYGQSKKNDGLGESRGSKAVA